MNFTTGYCGMIYAGEYPKLWVSVQRFRDGTAIMKVFKRGCGFTPTEEKQYPTVGQAMAAGAAALANEGAK